MSKFIVLGDVATLATAAVWSKSFGLNRVGERALTAFAISVIARVLSENSQMIPMVNSDQKNQAVVFILGGIRGYMMKGENSVQSALTSVAQDLLGNEVVRLINQEPGNSFYPFPGATGNANTSSN